MSGKSKPGREIAVWALDKALTINHGVVQRHVRRIRSSRPDASPAEAISALEKQFLAATITLGAAAGASAAVPGMTTLPAVAVNVEILFCPSNRTSGSIPLGPMAAEWGVALPPSAAACDYAFCKGANGSLHADWHRVPQSDRGVFNIRPRARGTGVTLLLDIALALCLVGFVATIALARYVLSRAPLTEVESTSEVKP